MAGTEIACACGRLLKVPSLGELRRRGATSFPGEAAPPGIDPADARPVSVTVAYILVAAWLCVGGLSQIVFSWLLGGPLAAGAALLVVAGQFWLFSLIFTGNPVAALVVLFIPIVGLCLAVQFVIDNWSIARWPALCQLGGLLLWLGAVFSR
jgi:hypothetical protein